MSTVNGIDEYALESAMWRVVYRLHRKDRPLHFENLLVNLNVEDHVLMEACDQLERIGSIDSDEDGYYLTGERWGDPILKTCREVTS